MGTARGRASKIGALIVYIIVILVATPQAQQPVAFSGVPGAMSAGPAALAPDATAIELLVGRSTILNVGTAISRVSLTVPDVADAMVTAPQQLLIHGKTPGTISLFVWDRAGGIKTYEVSVRRDLSRLIEQMRDLFPGEPIVVTGSGKDVVISGSVSSKYVIDKAADVTGGYVDKKENVVNLLKQIEGVASNQVMLRVRFAEVSRNALQELGVSLFTGATGYKDVIARSSTQQFAAPQFDEMSRTATLDNKLTGADGKYTLSDFLNLFIFSNKYNIGTVIKALETKGLFQSLAEPNLIASNGKEASFLAGGEYPYPVAQASSGGNTVSIMFKEYGVRLSFTPTVLGGDLINLKVRPEVSSLDFANGVSLSGFRVPALSTRRTETEVELQDGQTFAIAGLMNNTVSSTMSKVPGIGDIPILGYLFRSRAYQKQQTELVVMITPQIIRRGSTGVSQALPTIVEPYLAAPSKRLPQPAPYVGSPRYPADPPAVRSGGSEPVPAAAPQGSALQGSALQGSAPQASAPKTAAPVVSLSLSPSAVSPQPSAVVTPLPSVPVVMASAPKASAPRAEPKPDPKETARLRDAQRKAAEARKVADKKAEDDKAAADKKAEDDKAAADKKAAEEQARQQKIQAERDKREAVINAERAKREAEVAKKTAEFERRRQEEVKKHDKTVADAAARLRQAQAAYQAQVDKRKSDR